jgi:hypothetical protein
MLPAYRKHKGSCWVNFWVSFKSAMYASSLSNKNQQKIILRCEGRKPYGETSEEKQVINRIRAMRRTRKNRTPGMTLQAIADRLNSEGIPTRMGKQWTPGQVHSLLNRKKRAS